ncbi:MAG: hypothetical protein HRU15_20540, partial [Planctomycetes bacterium]|nr:hypothetical protein [Planctomycetota bacterium]
AGLLTGTGSKLVVEWEVSDLHLSSNPVDVDYSSDLENWSHLIHDQAASGSYVGKIPNDLTSCYLRLSVSDRAQNLAQSKIVNIGNTQVKNPLGDKQAATNGTNTKNTSTIQATTSKTTQQATENSAASALPSLNEVARAVDKELAHTDANNKPLPAKKFEIPAGHQDVIAPYANKPWPQDLKKSSASDQENLQLNATSDSHLNSKIINADVARILHRRKGRLIFGSDAEQVLEAARNAVSLGKTNHALVLYQRLRDSTVTTAALPEEIELLIGLKRDREAIEVITLAPPESMSTAIRVLEAQL